MNTTNNQNFNIFSIDSAAAAQNVGGGIGFGGNADSIRAFAAIQGFHESATASDYAGGLRFFTRPSGSANLEERMRITSVGDVGIGTTAPVAKLNVASSGLAFSVQNANQSVDLFEVDAANNAVIVGKVASGSGQNASASLYLGDTCDNFTETCLKIGEAGSGDTDTLQLHGANGLAFTTGYATEVTMAVLDASGRFGVGDISPTAQFEAESLTPGRVVAILQGDSGQTADILQLRDSSESVLASFDSAGNLTVNALGTSVFAGGLRIGDATDYAEFSATTGQLTFSGTARHTERIRLTAEYDGTVLDEGGQPATTGTMTSDYDMTNRMNYYKWTTSEATNQTYDVVTQVPVPENFDEWTGANLQISTYTSDITNGTITVDVIDSSGAHEFSTPQFASVTPGSTGTWASTSLTLDGSYTAGDYLTLRIRMQSPQGGDVRVGNIYLDYKSRF